MGSMPVVAMRMPKAMSPPMPATAPWETARAGWAG
jgi:hypothetical protein